MRRRGAAVKEPLPPFWYLVIIVSLPRLGRKLLRRPQPGAGKFDWDIEDYSSGNELTLYVRGKELYDAMEAAIEAATRTVHLETYIYASDKTGKRFAELMAKKARQGVRVRFIYDSVGSLDLDPALEMTMRNAGVQTLEYHPVAPWRPRWAWNHRDHRKLLVCDGAVGFIGGMNVCDDHLAKEDGGKDWADAQARVRGPAALALDELFRSTWHRHTGRWFDLRSEPIPPAGSSLVRIVGNQEFTDRFVIRELYANALRAAQRDVCIANSYFIPDWRIRRSLVEAARRGVRVRVLVPGESDVPSAWHAMRGSYERLLSRGIRIFEWQGPMMHAKAVCVDGKWSGVGSYNLDHRSLRFNLEANLHALDESFGRELTQQFERGVAGAREVTLEAWRKRPLLDRLLERFWSTFEYAF